MISQSLNGAWQFRQAGASDWLPGIVPGSVHLDLLANQRIPDPFFGENEKQVQWVSAADWEYRRTFLLDPALLAEETVELTCAGLDTLAEVLLNGQVLGRTDNIFRAYTWPVKALLRPGENELSIRFASPVKAVTERQQQRKLPTMMNGGMAHLRKVQSHFGWDWGPILPTLGIWQAVTLTGWSTARIEAVHLRQTHGDGAVTLHAGVRCAAPKSAANLSVELRLTGPDGSVQTARAAVGNGQADIDLPVERPQLWWPNGLGAQPLYTVAVTLCAGEQALDERQQRIGLRTVELRQDPDEWGRSFTFVINGVPIFAKGADWIPSDSLVTRMTEARYEHLVRSAAQANMNMLRVWGGGYYEDERFYDLCDRYGVLVWQDFGFACAAYPLDDPAFLTNVQEEVTQNVRRLRHHASLALWSGNNEIELTWPMLVMGKKKQSAGLTEAQGRFFHQTLRAWTAQDDPDTPYWPGSPNSGEFLKDTNGDGTGDTHLWGVWHGLKPFNSFRKHSTRFCSEFGLEALPAMRTIASFASRPEDYDLKSKVLLHHQRSVGGNEKMLYYLADRLRIPADFSDMVYETQIMQAEAIRAGVEHWRRNRPRCSGALFWQLNDCWPVTSWASIDYAGRWKGLQYAARRFYAPVALSIEEEGSRAALHVVNDTVTAWQGQVRWSLETLTGQVVTKGEEAVTVPPFRSVCAVRQDFAAALGSRRAELVLVAELWQGEQRLALQASPFVKEKNMALPDPHLSVKVTQSGENAVIELKAQALARFVVLELDGQDAIFSDNFFDLPAGRATCITLPLPAGWTAAQVRDALRVRSLADVRPAGSLFSDAVQHHLAGLKPINILTRILMGRLG
jgi:beta-mannosidase